MSLFKIGCDSTLQEIKTMVKSINNVIVYVMIASSGIAAKEALEREGTDPLSEVKKAIAQNNTIYFTASLGRMLGVSLVSRKRRAFSLYD